MKTNPRFSCPTAGFPISVVTMTMTPVRTYLSGYSNHLPVLDTAEINTRPGGLGTPRGGLIPTCCGGNRETSLAPTVRGMGKRRAFKKRAYEIEKNRAR